MPNETAQGSPAPGKPPHARGRAEPQLTQNPPTKPVREIGGPRGPEPTRYGDWERAGRCVDF